MASTMKPAPPRSPERQALSRAIEHHADAIFQHERVTDALSKIDEHVFDLQPAVRRAREVVDQALRLAPELLVARTLGEPPDPDQPTVADAEAALKEADRALIDARSARTMLRDELRDREYQVEQAKRALDAAVKAVVASDPAKLAVMREYFASGRRALRLARIIRTFGDIAVGVSDDESGLHFRVGDRSALGNMGIMYRPEPAWTAALAALREDPDAELPSLPEEPEPEPAAEPEAEPAEAAAA
jgi:hypothetical protein